MSADDIRAKRLAKLGSRPSNSSSGSVSSNNSAPVQRKAPEESQPPKKIPARSTSSDSASLSLPAKPSPPVKPKPVVSETEDIGNWLAHFLEDVCSVSLKPDGKGVYIESLVEELNSSNRLVNENDLESIFMEILTENGVPKPYKTPIQYLYHIYHELSRLRSRISKKETNLEKKTLILSTVVDLACNYGLICFQISDMFIGNDLKATTELFIDLFNLYSGFLTDIISKSIEQEALLELLNILLPTLSIKIAATKLNDPSYNKLLLFYNTLVDIKPVAAIFSQVDGFEPPDASNGLDYEHKTLLGPLLRLSPLIDELSVSYFGADFNANNYTAVDSVYSSISVEYRLVIDQLFGIINKLIRSSPETRNLIMKWFAGLVNVSHLRTGSHSDSSKLASDAIMFNVSIILIKLSAPFLEFPTYSKLDKIDFEYLGNPECLIDLKEETRINMTLKEAEKYYNQAPAKTGKPNFISDCFYLSLTYLHYGIGGITQKYDKLKRQIKQLEERIALIENNEVPPGTNPMMIQFLKQQLPKLNQQLSILNGKKHVVKAIFNYRDLQLEIFDFVTGATVVFSKVIDPTHQHPRPQIKIPIYQIGKVSELDDQEFLRTKCPLPWSSFPEFFLEGIINYCKFTTDMRSTPLLNNPERIQLFVEFLIIVLRCPELLGNPHMKSNIIEILFIGSLPLMNGHPGFLADIYHSNKLVTDNLLYSLLNIYVMIEKTGASSQFYDKFNSRYYISVILEELWKNEVYRDQLTKYSTDNIDFFVRFIARMLNDTTFLLDETFNELNSIHNYQQELKRRQAGQDGNEDEFGNTDELLKNLESSERKAKSYMGLCNKTMALFKLFTKEVPKGFMLPELVDRLAGMLDYNLEAMVGPKASNLKVEDPTKYDFNPKETLQSLCQVYYNLSNQPEFIDAVSRDGRSFNIEWFRKAERILSSKTLTDPQTIKRLAEFGEKAEEKRLEAENDETELGEIPDEFLDPLMFTLMQDPVILPSSKVSIDRATIKAHMLSDPTDPFNRVPLKLEDVVDDVELKEKIERFKQEKRAERHQNKMDVDS